ncbi:MAG: hypothetical protein U1F40_06230 [Turneriella sp.]
MEAGRQLAPGDWVRTVLEAVSEFTGDAKLTDDNNDQGEQTGKSRLYYVVMIDGGGLQNGNRQVMHSL